ncbi:hypothetical protein OSB04_020456 [Centaurea solstitialis]|uniref:Gnk2-homologous domain-containing protein n=1 Tax=Centaurea solstitialis TaxID=347529 RepID=A0AA38TBU9_9ASTR|nr:hypothetical protein OSB04_020456 [Centaurea solstitialis]
MASPANHFFLILLLHFLRRAPPSSAAGTTTSGLTNLIYKGCANQNFQDSSSSENLKSLYENLVSQSSITNFFKTTSAGDGNDQSTATSITGLYQCRGDLSNGDCNTCVKKLPEMMKKLCNVDTIAARVQLGGCYLRYEVIGFPAGSVDGAPCASRRASGSGFDERLAAALSLVPKGVANGKGYYAGGYQSVYVLGQCEGDLGGGECVNCVKSAVAIGKSECETAISGHVYLQQCYISYTYYPDGVPGAGNDLRTRYFFVKIMEMPVVEVALVVWRRRQRRTDGGDGGGGSGGRNNTEKTVAIVFGGLAGLGLVAAFLLVVISAFRKKKEHYSYGDIDPQGRFCEKGLFVKV